MVATRDNRQSRRVRPLTTDTRLYTHKLPNTGYNTVSAEHTWIAKKRGLAACNMFSR